MDGRSLLSGMAIGAVLTLAFDSTEGTRRRAAWRARLSRASRTASAAMEEAVRDVSHRAAAVVDATRTRFVSNDVDDRTLLRRVGARLGRLCAYPDAVEVSVADGVVTLHGPVLADEVRRLLAAAASVRGVHAIVNDLDACDTPEDLALRLEATESAGRTPSTGHDRVATAGRALVGVAALAAGGLALAYSRK